VKCGSVRPGRGLPTTDEIRHYEARLAREPTSQAYAALAEAYRREGRAAEAAALCREGLGRHPGYATTRLVLARALLDTGDVRGARTEIERFLASESAHEPGLRLAVECALRDGDPTGALRDARRLAALDPHDRSNQGLLRALEVGVTRRVAADAGGLWPILGDDTYTTVAFGDLCSAQGLTDEAMAVFSRILVREPDHEIARTRLGELGKPRGSARRPRG
jgi:tetratricopeptide (TPR) repeat protein